MGAFNGPITVSRLWIRGEPEDDFRSAYEKTIRLRTFQPLKPEDEVDERVGWCAAGQALDLELEYEKIFKTHFLTLGLRIDRYRIPPALLKAHLDEAATAYLARTGRERLSKAEKDDLVALTRTKLKRQLLPQMKVVDFVWDLSRGAGWFWSQSPTVIDKLTALFEQTFGLELDIDSPFVAARELKLGKALEPALETVQPSALHAKKGA